jgi:hypothetical protein
MIRRFASIAVLMLFVAWGREGHEIVGAIAQNLLNDDAKAQIADLLDNDSLAAIANWADDVRHTSAYSSTAPYHFADMQRGEEEFVLARDCPPQGCVVKAITDYTAILADTTKTKAARAEALMFLVHFVGDIHQPLHVGYAEDKGGNDITVHFFNKQMKLHAVWDTGLLDRVGKAADDYATDLMSRTSATDKTKWTADLDPVHWATDSHGLAVSYAYLHVNGTEIKNGDTLEPDYVIENVDVVNQQLSKAGVRLAAILNKTLSKPSASDVTTTEFVGSKNSDVYHYPTCRIVKDIKPENLVKYTTAPAGKHLHKGCPW